MISAVYLKLANAARIPVVLHLDHCTDPAFCRLCADSGYTNIMIDGSKRDYAGNIAVMREVVEYCHFHSSASVRLYRLFREGSLAEARLLHLSLVRLNQAVSGKHGVAGVKAAMNAAGFVAGSPRLSFAPLSREESDALDQTFTDAGFPLHGNQK